MKEPGSFVLLHSVRPAAQYEGASNSTLTLGEWSWWSGAAPPHILRPVPAAGVRFTTLHTQDFPGKIEMRDPHDWKANSLRSFRQIKNHRCRSVISFSCTVIESVHLQQGLPHTACSSSIASIRGIPLNTILLLPFRNLWRSQGFPPTNHHNHKRNGTVVCKILRNQEDCSNLPHCSTLSKNSTTSPLVSSVKTQRNFGIKAIALHSCLCLVTLCGILKLLLQKPSAYAPPNSSTLRFSTVRPSNLVHSYHIANAPSILFSSPHMWPKA